MMFTKVVFVLVTVANIAYGQFLPQGPSTVRLIPISFGGGAQVGLSAAQPQFVIAGGAVPTASAGLQLIRQPQAVQLVAAQQPQAVQFVSAPQPQSIQFVSQPAPQAAQIQFSAPAPQPARIQIAAPAPQPARIQVSAPAPQPARIQVTAPAPAVEDDYYEPGTPVAPYAFSFDETDEFGMNLQRNEVSENGIVTGQYSFTTPEGYTRLVKYVSDEKGFRAEVETNEPGTASSSPADAEYRSSYVAQAQPPK
uniref:Translation initiation factor IF-2-like isoform X3 n=1 Tax=Dermatophagoides pteronyssinus TaxID=6956 RepID=A0A6P6XYF6_DERPT|nr:translation initiation factor IF-2-like isoform X3 [Dermatophagoides pteronyssinus]